MQDREHFLFLNIGHFLDHLFMLIFATVAALVLVQEWGLPYAELVLYATPGFVAFGLFSLPAGRIADRWSREAMMAVFFIGAGLSAIVTSTAQTPPQIAACLSLVGIFGAIYHPVGLALVAHNGKSMGLDIAINGVWGNMGVAVAALLTGILIDSIGWRSAFWLPGCVSVLTGVVYCLRFCRGTVTSEVTANPVSTQASPNSTAGTGMTRRELLIRAMAIIFITSAIGSMVFQGTTFALPKVFAERLAEVAPTASMVGWLAFIVFAVASMAQLIVGKLLDRVSARTVFMCVAALQIVSFSLMPSMTGWSTVVVSLAFMIGAFGQIPINDYLIGRLAKSELRASVYGARYVVTFSVFAAVLPLLGWIHKHWGFDVLFYILAVAACGIFCAVALLPDRDGNGKPLLQQ